MLYGGNTPANAQLEYVTIEYGGSNLHGANIGVTNGYLQARNTTIRNSQHNGVRFNSSGYGTVINSQVVDNSEYGVRNTHPTVAVLATNNWWGDPSGPDPDTAACGAGTGRPGERRRIVPTGADRYECHRPVSAQRCAGPHPDPAALVRPRRWAHQSLFRHHAERWGWHAHAGPDGAAGGLGGHGDRRRDH